MASIEAGRRLKPPARRLDDWSRWDVAPVFGFPAANFSDHAWAGRPPRAGERANMPLYWCKQSAELSAAADRQYPGTVAVDPSPGWGDQGTLLTVPKAIIYPIYAKAGTTNLFNSIIQQAIAPVAAALAGKRVYAGPTASVGHQRGSAVPCGLPWTAVNEIEEPLANSPGETITVFGRAFDAANCVAGEVLYVHAWESDGSGFPPYFFDDTGVAWEEFDLQRADDRAFLEACRPLHKRARWLAVYGVDDVIERGGVFDGEKTEDRLAELSSDWADFGFVGAAVPGQPRLSASCRAAMAARIESEIRDFFGV
jgi:hypothetical protein